MVVTVVKGGVGHTEICESLWSLASRRSASDHKCLAVADVQVLHHKSCKCHVDLQRGNLKGALQKCYISSTTRGFFQSLQIS